MTDLVRAKLAHAYLALRKAEADLTLVLSLNPELNDPQTPLGHITAAASQIGAMLYVGRS